MNRQILGEFGQPLARKKDALAAATERNENAVIAILNRLPGLVDAVEVQRLKTELSSASLGKSFILQAANWEQSAGVAAYGVTTEYTKNFGSVCKYLTLMLRKPVVAIGFARDARVTSLGRVASIETLASDGLQRDAVEAVSARLQPHELDISRSLETYLAKLRVLDVMRRGNFPSYIAHATGKLSFEEALLRRCPESHEPYASSGHLLEIEGIDLIANGEYSKFLRQIANPISIRIGPGLTSERLLTTCALLNPRRQTGKVVLVGKLGEQRDALVALVRALRRANVPAVWTFDPAQQLDAGASNSDVVSELAQAASLLVNEGSRLAGLCLTVPSEERHRTSLVPAKNRRVAGEDGLLASSRLPERQYLQLLRLCSELAHAQEV